MPNGFFVTRSSARSRGTALGNASDGTNAPSFEGMLFGQGAKAHSGPLLPIADPSGHSLASRVQTGKDTRAGTRNHTQPATATSPIPTRLKLKKESFFISFIIEHVFFPLFFSLFFHID
jgi:hypothetical protein